MRCETYATFGIRVPQYMQKAAPGPSGFPQPGQNPGDAGSDAAAGGTASPGPATEDGAVDHAAAGAVGGGPRGTHGGGAWPGHPGGGAIEAWSRFRPSMRRSEVFP